ncbi:tyrosine-protein phosphatase non-receptor type 9-like isoform X2 [Lytechinus variegatus]|uniref:tyrosine-protein phosphatase non-receptor type 9-like isoform X2 n=1 Tax=Lytechinus variegatus TaxID=7654 RepID=UPI001BB12DEF|nr:tyrosine-protein phosphatase non-receptor type 9-like isoform X2 [Lytechinus variegatus]
MARKFDVKRALELFRNHGPLRDGAGAAIALFSARYHTPNSTPTQAVLQAAVFQLDQALSSYETQRNGLTWIYNMTGSSFTNFDLNMSKKLLGMLRDGYPARLKRIYVVTPPLWFKAMYKILTPLLKEKIKERVTLVSAERLCRYLPATSLPKDLGGTADVKHLDWLNSCLDQNSDKNRNSRDLSDSLVDTPEALEANQKAVELYAPERIDRISDIDSPSAGFLVDISHRGSTDSLQSSHSGTLSDPIRGSIEDMKTNCSSSDSANGTGNGQLITDSRGNGSLKDHMFCEMDEEKIQKDAKEKHEMEIVEKDGDSDGIPEGPPPKPPRPRPNDSPPPVPDRKDLPVFSATESVHQPTDSGMDIEALVSYILNMRQSGIYKEYAAIRAEPPAGTFYASKHRLNVHKNRYADVLCYDHSRVFLPLLNGDPYSDYLNANYMDGYKQKNAFIATQGPLPKTFSDFWLMIWENQVRTIVMTTRTVERGRLKCGQYWPLEEGTSGDYGKISVANLEVETRRDYTITLLTVHNSSTGESRRITHFQFTSWPDFGTPRSALAMLEFREEVRQYQSTSVKEMGEDWTEHPGGPPIVVHCSAGIGRTGTFCTLDISLARLEDVGTIDVCNTVRLMRAQRAYSIQTPDQYEFCYFALVEYAQRGDKLPSSIDFRGYEDSESDSDD